MKLINFNTLFWFTCLIVLSWGATALALQIGDGTKFTTLRDNIRQLERDISKKFASMPVGFPEQQKKALAEIEAIRSQVADLRKQLDQTAIESFSADPMSNYAAASHILQMAISCLEGRGNPRPFDPARAYELGTLLSKAGKPTPQVLSMAHQACLAMQDFDRAERILKKLRVQGITVPESVDAHLEKLKKSWAKEIAKRESEQQLDTLPRVKLETDLGDIVIELFEDDSPKTVANFISLVDSGFYNNRAFFSVKPGNMVRTGCPKDNGTGDPGYRIANEPTSGESRRFFAGTVGMYHEGANTAGSQFFITYQPRPDYDLNYVAFGRVIEGLEVLYSLPRTEPSTGKIDTSDPKRIKTATVIRKRDHSYEPEKIATLSALEQDPGKMETPPPMETTPEGGIPDVAPTDPEPSDPSSRDGGG